MHREVIGGQASLVTIAPVDALRIGRSLRALRIRRRWRQVDVAARAGMSAAQYSRIERGELRSVPVQHVEAACQALGADLDVRVRWHGEGLDRLLDEAHAGLVDRVARLLTDRRWDVAIEVSFNVFGERGSIDILGWHAETRTLLVVEVKSVVPDAQAMLAALDRKSRLASKIGRSRAWEPRIVGTLLAIADNSTARQRIDALPAMFGSAFPVRGPRVHSWLRSPSGPLMGLLFLRKSPPGGRMERVAGRERVRLSRKRSAAA